MRAATKVWLATAQLQRERGPHADFSKEEIARRVEVAGWTNGPGTETVRVHISSHCVASARPNPARDRMLTRTRWGHYRLYRPGDPTHPGRATGRVHPAVEDVPPPFLSLLRWYEDEYLPAITPRPASEPDTADGDAESELPEYLVGVPPGMPRDHPMLKLRKLAMESGIWKGIDPDEYVRELREGWD